MAGYLSKMFLPTRRTLFYEYRMFDWMTYQAEEKRILDEALNRALPSERERPEVLHRAMRHLVFPGGKRLRPILCRATAMAVGGNPDDALPAAIAIELLHTYTLIHDDLPCMDDDLERRGQPTVHVAFGEANAVLAGDALQALAFETLAGTRGGADGLTTHLVRELARAAGSRGVVGGQVEDIAAAGSVPTREILEFIHQHKTADLFCAAVRMGAMTAGADAATLAGLTTYGTHLGLAFQMIDDLQDGAKDPHVTTGELNALPLYGVEGARRRAETHVDRALAGLACLPQGPTEPLRAIAAFTISRTH